MRFVSDGLKVTAYIEAVGKTKKELRLRSPVEFQCGLTLSGSALRSHSTAQYHAICEGCECLFWLVSSRSRSYLCGSKYCTCTGRHQRWSDMYATYYLSVVNKVSSNLLNCLSRVFYLSTVL